ncbi:MAG TPA: hypothetical protein VFS97_13645 [Nitrososphaeraceae archaeon]|nr:hypothetical protein [Nitrososphaeraceae archaeon]
MGTDGHNGAVSRLIVHRSLRSSAEYLVKGVCFLAVTLANNTVETFQLTGLRVG